MKRIITIFLVLISAGAAQAERPLARMDSLRVYNYFSSQNISIHLTDTVASASTISFSDTANVYITGSTNIDSIDTNSPLDDGGLVLVRFENDIDLIAGKNIKSGSTTDRVDKNSLYIFQRVGNFFYKIVGSEPDPWTATKYNNVTWGNDAATLITHSFDVLTGDVSVTYGQNRMNLNGDTLSNVHIKTGDRNIALGTGWISGLGDNKGIQVNNAGQLIIEDQPGVDQLHLILKDSNGNLDNGWGSQGLDDVSLKLNNQYYLSFSESAFAGQKPTNTFRINWLHDQPNLDNPLYSFRSDPNTGYSWAGQDSVQIVTNGVSVMQIAQSGTNVTRLKINNADSIGHDVWIGGAAGSTPWSLLDAGDASFTVSSDSTKKENFIKIEQLIDGDVLQKILRIPVYEFNFREEAATLPWDSTKIAGWDTLSHADKQFAKTIYKGRMRDRAKEIAKRKYLRPNAQSFGQIFGRQNDTSIKMDEQIAVMWRAIQLLTEEVNALKTQNQAQQLMLNEVMQRIR